MRKVSDQLTGGLPGPPLRAALTRSAPLKALLAALREHDAYTYRHSLRTVRLSLLVGRACGLAPALLRAFCLGALVHDAGKLFVPWGVLHKRGRLTQGEWEAVRRHPADGARLLFDAQPASASLRVVAEHHERWDGGGYPSGLRAGRIDTCARIVAVADSFDAMTSERPYRRARGYDEAAAELGRCAGSQFDPRVVEAFCQLPREFLERVIGGGASA
jgi:HD-GYP domain-containing protein (c-di-GMP phosphodiesterase class II)